MREGHTPVALQESRYPAHKTQVLRDLGAYPLGSKKRSHLGLRQLPPRKTTITMPQARSDHWDVNWGVHPISPSNCVSSVVREVGRSIGVAMPFGISAAYAYRKPRDEDDLAGHAAGE